MGEVAERTVPITRNLRLDGFQCGKPDLDDWLRERALRSEGDTARTYVLPADTNVAGYYSLATASEIRSNLPSRLRRNAPDPVPLMLIARLAVDVRYAGRGIGSGLLMEALQRVLEASDIVSCRGALVHAIDDEAAGFYRRYGFIPFPGAPGTLILAIDTFRKAAIP